MQDEIQDNVDVDNMNYEVNSIIYDHYIFMSHDVILFRGYLSFSVKYIQPEKLIKAIYSILH